MDANLNAGLTAGVIAAYFVILLVVARLTTKKNDNATFFTANRNSPWYLVAFGMIGTSISGVTFISVPGQVGSIFFYYFQVVLGYWLGYMVIIKVLLPLYYRLNLTSIYTYLEQRYGINTYKTGAFYFLLSRSVGSALRLYLAAMVFQIFIFNEWGFPFELSVAICMALILLYSIRGGVKTIIWTDTLQTFFLVLALILTIIFLNYHLGWGLFESVRQIADSPMSQIFNWDYNSKFFFVKQLLAGMFITITMTGLDQDLMQKNLTCKSLADAQKNMTVFSFIIIAVNILFLSMGVLLYMYSAKNGIAVPKETDQLFPQVALAHFPVVFKFVFLIGLTAATFASTDSALTALTTSVCIDFLGFNKEGADKKVSTRYAVHIIMAAIIVFMIYVFYHQLRGEKSVIDAVLKYAGYTYGPLLGLYSFGLFSRRLVPDSYVTRRGRIIPIISIICIIAPFLTYYLERLSGATFPEYKIGSESIVINGLLVYFALYVLSLFYPQRVKNL
jgi:Na+/proline symporter